MALALGAALAGLALVVAPALRWRPRHRRQRRSVRIDGGIGSSTGSAGSDGGAMNGPWTALPAELSVQGGSALAASGQGQNGGTVHLISQGDTSFDPTMAPGADHDPGRAGRGDGDRSLGAGGRPLGHAATR